MTFRSRLAIATLVLAGTVPGIAAAQAVDAAGAQRLQTLLQGALDKTIPAGTEGITLEGQVRVEPQGSYYQVTYPAVTLGSAAEGTFEVGSAVLNMVPAGEGLWRAKFALPRQMVGRDAAGQPTVTITIGNQQSDGMFSEALMDFTSYSATLSDIRFDVAAAGEPDATLSGVEFRRNYTSAGNDLWNGGDSFALRGFSVQSPEASVSIGAVEAVSETRELNWTAVAALNRTFQELQTSSVASGTGQPSEAALAALRQQVTQMPPLLGSTTVEFSISDVSIRPAQVAEGEPTAVEFDRLALTFGAEGLRGPQGSVVTGLAHQGLEVEGLPEEQAQLVPTRSQLQVSLAGIPNVQVWQLITQALQAADGSPEAGEQFGQQLMATLVQAGTNVSISQGQVEAPGYTANLGGQFQLNAQSPVGLVGEATLVLTGLVEAPAGGQAPAQGGQQARTQLPGATMMLMMMPGGNAGQMGVDAQGRQTLTYVVKADAQGNATINGQPLPQ